MSVRMTADMFESQVWKAVENQFDALEKSFVDDIKGGDLVGAERLQTLELIRTNFRMLAVDVGVAID